MTADSNATTDAPAATGPMTPPPAIVAERVAYGVAEQQFGDLYLPGMPSAASTPDASGSVAPPSSGPEASPLAVVVLIHGGFWRNTYGLDLMTGLAQDLVADGYAVWNIEYRRLGDPGGGWPGTLEDVAVAVDHLAELDDTYPLDLSRVAIVGHSAGGHLAMWAGGRGALPDGAPGAQPVVTPVVVVGQGPVVDLRSAAAAGLSSGVTELFLGGSFADVPDRYDLATPRWVEGVRAVSVVGSRDDIVPPSFSVLDPNAALPEVAVVEGADHFDLIDPSHPAWTTARSYLPPA